VGCLLLACPYFLSAQQNGTSSPDTVGALREVVITASRKASMPESSPFSISVLNSKQIGEFMYRSSPEALTSVPGVFVQKTNHGGGSAFVRGLTGNQTLILVDGIRLNNSTFRYGPNQYLNTIDHFTVRQIEVVRGSGSVQYGSDAMGGVIQVLTHDAQYSTQNKLSGYATGRYWNSNMEKTGRGQAMYSTPKLAVIGGISLKKFGDLKGGDTTGRQGPSGYGETDADIKLKWKLAENAELTAAHQYVQQDNVPVYHKFQLENFALNEMELQRRNLSYLKLNLKNSNQFYRSVLITGSFQESTEIRNSQKNGNINRRKEHDGINTSNASIDVLSHITPYWSANSGSEYYFDKIGSYKEDRNVSNNTSTRGRGLYPDKASYSNASFYSLHHLNIKKLTIEAGARYNWFSASISDDKLGAVKISPNAVVFNTGASYKLGAHNVYASFSSGYRAPNIDDMGTLGIVDFRYELPSFGLQPERSYNTELGYKLYSDNWKGTLAVFNNKLSNLITRVKNEGEKIEGYTVYRKENVENASIRGAEASLQWQPDKKWIFNTFAAYTYGKNITQNEPLRRTPPLNGNTSVRYSFEKLYLTTEFGWAAKQSRLAQGDKDDNRISKGGTPGWNIINVYAGYQYKMLQFRMSGQNLLNEDYRFHGSGINSVGRSALMEVKVSF
jgi:outer membrane receptor protein involved in Fe transport